MGAGAAAMAAAYELQDQNILMLDIGHTAPDTSSLDKNLYELKAERKTLFNELIGSKFESLHNIAGNYLSPKLKSPYMKFITDKAEELSPLECRGFEPVQSFALGGLANAWGAGLLEYNEYDLKQFPISCNELKPFYEKLSGFIGINGSTDDLTPYLGETKDLQPAHNLNGLSCDFLKKYQSHKKYLNDKSFYIGRHRIALLTEKLSGREATTYDNLEFFKPNIPSIYNPAFTINELIKKNKLNYKSGIKVVQYRELNDGVEVTALNLNDQSTIQFTCKKLILSAGCLNTSRIVLNSHNDFSTKLPILDNAISYIPLLVPKFIGSPLEKKSFAAQLLIIYDNLQTEERIQATFYGLNGPLKSDLLFDFPLSMKGNFAAAKFLIPAMAIAQLFYEDSPHAENFIQLERNNKLKVVYQHQNFQKNKVEKQFIKAFRKLGYYGHQKLCKFPEPGNSFHYAGSLPMSKLPRQYQTSINGLLFGSKSVYISDAANFPHLPSKNHSFTIMANSMRIACHLKQQVV